MNKVLLVDDETIFIEALSDAMRRRLENTEFHLASDGQEGWDIFQKIKPHIVITDYSMPRLNGDGLAHNIRQAGGDTRIILVSGYIDDIEHSMYDEIMRKPVKPTELAKVLRQYLGC